MGTNDANKPRKEMGVKEDNEQAIEAKIRAWLEPDRTLEVSCGWAAFKDNIRLKNFQKNSAGGNNNGGNMSDNPTIMDPNETGCYPYEMIVTQAAQYILVRNMDKARSDSKKLRTDKPEEDRTHED